MRKVGTIAATALATSCALIGGLDDYRARSEPADASSAGDAEERDGAVDAGAEDGAADSHADGAVDGGEDGAARRACDLYPDAEFCDDFDLSPLGATWDNTAPLGGALALDASSPFSPPFFLEARIGPVGQNGFGPRLRKDLGARDTISVRAHIGIEPGKTSIPVRFEVQTAQSHDIRLEHIGGTSFIEEVNYSLSNSQVGAPFAKSLDDTWQEVVIKISFKTRKVDVTVGNQSALVGQDLVLGDWTGTATVAVLVGLPFVVSQATSVTSGIDDVVVLSE